MRRLTGALLLLAAILCGCTKTQETPPPLIATPGPVQTTQIQGLFRGEDEPAEVVVLDSEHGFWAYRTDTLGIAAEFYEDDLGGGMTAWCMAEIAWRETDPLTNPAEAAGSVLFIPETERLTLVENGEIMAEGGARVQRAGYGRLPDGGYIAIAVSGRYEGESVGLSAGELAGLFLDAGCDWAAQLAEGSAASMAFMGVPLNDPLEKDAAPVGPAGGVGWGHAQF